MRYADSNFGVRHCGRSTSRSCAAREARHTGDRRAAIRQAILLPARKPPEWLRQAAATAQEELLAESPPNTDGSTDGDDSGARA